MKIGIIGAGHIGTALAKHFTQLGHTVNIANSRGPQTLGEVAQKTGATPVEMKSAPAGAEILVITIPLKAVPDLPKDLLKDLPSNAIVIDTCNYYPAHRDGRIQEIDNGTPESVWVSQHIGHPVIKVFNNIISMSLEEDGKPKGAPGRIALPVAGDDATAKQRVLDLVEQIGFDAYDAGTLAESWRQEPGTPAYCTNLDLATLPGALAAANHSESLPKAEQAANKMFAALGSGASPQQIVNGAREMWPNLPQQG
jgi:8-hydroxy-5-deazaflavin:NADPH oxidoreductase